MTVARIIYDSTAALDPEAHPIMFEVNGKRSADVSVLQAAMRKEFVSLAASGGLCEQLDGELAFTANAIAVPQIEHVRT